MTSVPMERLKLDVIRWFCILFHDALIFCRHGNDTGFRIWGEVRLRNHDLFSLASPVFTGQATVDNQAYIHLILHCNEFTEMILRPVVSLEAGAVKAISCLWNSQLQKIKNTDPDPYVIRDRTGAVMTFPVLFPRRCQLMQISGSKLEFRYLTARADGLPDQSN